MKLYIVRHGESEANASKVFQDGTSSLSQKGFKQAEELGKRVAKINGIDFIVCSPYLRTRQTLEQILKYKNHEVIFSDLAVEIIRAQELIGKSRDNEEVIKIHKEMHKNSNDPSWHYSNEENFYDFKNRTIELLKYIENFGNKNILLVCHGILSKMIISIMLFGENLTPNEYESIREFFKTENTGITVCNKDEEEKWQLTTWNDHAHLG